MPGPIFLPKPQTPGNGGGTAIDQNNKVREVYVGIIRGNDNAPTYDRHIADFMTVRGLTIADDEIVVIEAVIGYREYSQNYTESKIAFYRTQLMVKSGAGEYGPGLKEFTENDFLRIKKSTSFDSSAFDGTEIIDLGDIQDYGIANFINVFEVRQFDLLEDKIYLFKNTEFNEAKTYLYTGPTPVTIGDSAPDQVQNDNFQLVEKDGNPVTSAPTDVPTALSQLTDDIGATDLKTILVREKSQIVNQELDPTKTYKIAVPSLVLGPDDSIIVPSELILKGYGFNVTSIVQPNENGKIFTSPEGGSGNLNLINLNNVASGANAQVFDLIDSDNDHEISFTNVNFSGCASLGTISGYRQGTGDNVGVYGCADGLQLAGNWNGFKIETTNVFGFGAAGTLFKKAPDTSFANRFFINVNIDFPMGAVLCDFENVNFEAPELFQINSSIAKVDGSINIDAAGWLLPNISANDIKSLWVGNIGLPDTATELLTENDNVSGEFVIDWLKDTYFLTLTGDTTFSQINLPADTKNTQEIKLYLTGDFIPTFPEGYTANLVGTYKGADVNEIAVKYIRNGLYFVRISNSLSVYPAPDLRSVEPSSMKPQEVKLLSLKGSFFTPQTVVKSNEVQIDTVEFVNSGEMRILVTSLAEETDVVFQISNGTNVSFENKFNVILGEVTVLDQTDTSNNNGFVDFSELGNAKITTPTDLGTADWLTVPNDEIFQIRFQSALSTLNSNPDQRENGFSFYDTANGNLLFNVKNIYTAGAAYRLYINGTAVQTITITGAKTLSPNEVIILEKRGSQVRIKMQGDLSVIPFYDFTPSVGDLKIRINVKTYNLVNVRHIKLEN